MYYFSGNAGPNAEVEVVGLVIIARVAGHVQLLELSQGKVFKMTERCFHIKFCRHSWNAKWICVEDKVAGIMKHYLYKFLVQEEEKLVFVIDGPNLQRNIQSKNASSPGHRKLLRNHFLR